MQFIGDYNGDGGIDVSDILAVIDASNNAITLTEQQRYVLNINRDGGIDVSDILGVIDLSNDVPFEESLTFSHFKLVKQNNKLQLFIDLSKFEEFNGEISGFELYVSGVRLKQKIENGTYITNKNAFLENWIVASNTIKRNGLDGWTKPDLSIIYMEIQNTTDVLNKSMGQILLCELEYDLIGQRVRFYSNSDDFKSMVVGFHESNVVEYPFRVLVNEQQV